MRGDGKGKGGETCFQDGGQMTYGGEILNLESRPLHRAYLGHKLPCPHVLLRAKLSRAFFDEKGLAQHFQAKHGGDRFNGKIERQAWRLFK